MKRPSGIDALDRIHDLRRLSTDAERVLWKHLRGRKIAGAKFRRQVWAGSYIADFVCLEARLIVEADGSQHVEQVDYDDRRTKWLADASFRVLQSWNVEILTNSEGVVRMIAVAIEEPTPSHAQAGAGPSLSPNGKGDAYPSPIWGKGGARSPLGEWKGEGRL